MTKAEAEQLAEELWDLVNQGPGRNEEAMRRVRQIERAFSNDPNTPPYVREKVGSAESWFTYWLTPGRWKPWGLEKMRTILQGDIYVAQSVIRSGWPDGDDGYSAMHQD